MGWTPQQGRSARERLVGFVAGGEFGLQFALPDDPNQIRGADGAYVPAAQLAAVGWNGQDYFPQVPHLVVEVISPSERADDVAEKVQDYLAGGAHRVWCVYAERRAIHIHDADAPTRVIRGDGSLTDEELLPGFVLPLNLVFSEPTEGASG
jgi:Uma2 family endonuclease